MFAVNDYLAIKTEDPEHPYKNINDRYKQKGSIFLEGFRLGKGKRYPEIISRALNQYFINNTPIADTINNCNNISDFTRFEKTGKQFNVFLGDIPTQLTNRFYASTNGDYLNKRKLVSKIDKKTGNSIVIESKTSILKDVKVSLANKYIEQPFDDYCVNRQWYIDTANDILNQFVVFNWNAESNWDSEFLANV